MKQYNKNPTCNFNITPTTFSITSTGANGLVNVSSDPSSLQRGQSVILSFSGGSAGGYTTLQEYWVIPNNTGSFYIADSLEDAMDGISIASADGDAGVGTVYPSYKIGGALYVSVAGNVTCRGLYNKGRGVSSYSTMTVNVGFIPCMIKDISTYNTTATTFCVWHE